MKIAHKKSLSKKKKILISIAALLLVGGGAAALYFFTTQRNNSANADQPRPVNSVDYNPPTKEEEKATTDQKDQIISDYDKGQTGSDPNTTNDITVTISRANQTSAALSIGAIIDGAKSGTCTVTLARAGQPTITKTFTIDYDVTYGFCQEAIVPIEEFSASGEWQLSVTATNGDKTSKPATQTVNIDKP